MDHHNFWDDIILQAEQIDARIYKKHKAAFGLWCKFFVAFSLLIWVSNPEEAFFNGTILSPSTITFSHWNIFFSGIWLFLTAFVGSNNTFLSNKVAKLDCRLADYIRNMDGKQQENFYQEWNLYLEEGLSLANFLTEYFHGDRYLMEKFD